MNPLVSAPAAIALALSIGALLATGCSGSGSDDPRSPFAVEAIGPDEPIPAAGDDDGAGGDVPADDPADATTGETPTDTPPAGAADTPSVVQDPAAPNPADPDPAVPDPLVQNTTRVDFDIEVPAYRSDALQVDLAWGEKRLAATWVGDTFWSASDDFSTNTEHLLTVTFRDDGGAVTLGSVEALFRTGTNASESIRIAAEQFDTGRWDDDGDGISNLDERIAGLDATAPPRVLLFSETRDYRHDSIAVALDALDELAASAGIRTERAGDSAGLFTDAALADYDAVVWVLTSGDVLDADEQAAFERYIRSGGGYAGIHAASDTEYDWPWYGDLVGAYFDRHPPIQSATQDVEDGSHPSTAHLGARWTRTDEWYDYRANPRARVNVLLTLDERSYAGGGMGDDHPSAWYHDHDGGRSWYTGGGHTEASYAEPDFRAHLLGGLRHAAGRDGRGPVER